MLTAIDEVVTTTTTSVPSKTIAQMYYGNSNTLVYTVPTGRVFEGHIWGDNVTYQNYIVVNGASVVTNQNNTVSTQATWPSIFNSNIGAADAKIKLHAGDAVYSGPNSNYRLRVFGEERDA